MSTPRTVKASEVVKGMRVRVEFEDSDQTIQAWEGTIAAGYGRDTSGTLSIGSRRIVAHSDHPVTVLADPEPEWVEGAWYWVELQDQRTLMRRVGRGWSALADTEYAFHSDNNVTVLGRVLVVDWPGDDVARGLIEGTTNVVHWRKIIDLVADGIRTQGGVR